jgi:hypothetical protein
MPDAAAAGQAGGKAAPGRRVVLGWRDEIDVVLQEWIAASGAGPGGQYWRRVGAARPGTEPGHYVVDIRALDLSADEVDVLRLAGPDKESIAAGFPVFDATFDGELLRLRAAEFAAPPEPHLWRLRHEPAFLVKSLRDGFKGLPDAGLANLLAQGEVGGKLPNASPPAWLQNGQEAAYLACRGEGLWLVWGPPGTGKTRVLRSAIGDLLQDGKRVLLVSGANVAVDNALHEVLKERRFRPGEIVRVGRPQLTEISGNQDVFLPLMVRSALAQLEEQRHAAAEELRAMNDRQEKLESLNAQLTGFDPAAYDEAAALLAVPGGSAAEAGTALTQTRRESGNVTRALQSARTERAAAQAAAASADPVRPLWTEVSRLEAELAVLQQEATRAELLAQQARTDLETAQAAVTAWQQRDGKVRWRDHRAHREALRTRDDKRAQYEQLRAAAAESGRTASAARWTAEPAITRLEASAPLSRGEIRRRDSTAAQADANVRTLERAQQSLVDQQTRQQTALSAARAAEQLIATCAARGWPGQYAQASDLRAQTARDASRRSGLQERHDNLRTQYERLGKDAQGEIIAKARLVATTLAQFRLLKAVFDGPYDVVLIDEAGAATLPEVLLAVAKAAKCAVLFGDFMQLGPVIPELERSDRSDIRKWLVTDVFRHCGISTLDEARNHPSCLVLDTQHRFGPDVMRFANLLTYDGLLKAGPAVRAHAEGDPEIVLLDTDELGDLDQVQHARAGAVAGWWPAGLLLSRMIAEMHHESGEVTGVVTPYKAQAEATREALRDLEQGGTPIADVGTAHRFQGREFPVVVFDTVESQHNKPMWIGQASRLADSSKWQRDGVRVFNVAATRVKHRLYVVASQQRVLAAGARTPLGQLAALMRDRQVTSVRAASLVTPSSWDPVALGPEGAALAQVLARHIEVTDIHDEKSFYAQLTLLISQAQHSIWIWSAWVANRVYRLLPLLQEAADRGVAITVFTRDPSDRFQGSERSAAAVSALRDVVTQLIEVNVAHQKIIVIDDHTVMMGSLNALSQQRSREAMITMRGQYFARRLLRELRAEEYTSPPVCGACQQQVALRQTRDDVYWRCYNKSCPAQGQGRYKAWVQQVKPQTPR